MAGSVREAGDGLTPLPLPDGLRVRTVEGINGLGMHALEAGESDRPLLLLLHGFPELAYSWRKVMPPLAEAGFWVVAPDQRGYGRTVGAETGFGADLAQYRPLALAHDALRLVRALGREGCALVGHDFGAIVAAHAALWRPDVFRRVALMSAPFGGPPGFGPPPPPDVDARLEAVGLQHYQRHYATSRAEAGMLGAPCGLPAFLRAYFHMKGGAWHENDPAPLADWSAAELARLPRYYVMRKGETMGEAVAAALAAAADPWLPDAELAVYAAEYARTGFQGGLNWYAARRSGRFAADTGLFAGLRLRPPCCFIAGARDWGIHQSPGVLGRMPEVCADWRGLHLVPGAGHWVQQEAPGEVVERLLHFLREP